MGCGPSSKSVGVDLEPPGAARFDKCDQRVQEVSVSVGYCLLQETRNRSVVFIDVRKPPVTPRIRESVSPWDPPIDQSKLSGWYKSLCDLRTVVLYNSGKTSDGDIDLVASDITASKARPREIVFVQGGAVAFARRFPFCMSDCTNVELPAPAEMLESKRETKGKGLGSVYVCGEAVVRNSESSLDALKIKNVINLTNSPCPLDPRKFKVKNLPCYSDVEDFELPYDQAAQAAIVAQKRKQNVLLYDHSGDAHSCAVSAWMIIKESTTSVEAATGHVKRRRPAAQFDVFVVRALTALKRSQEMRKDPPRVHMPKPQPVGNGSVEATSPTAPATSPPLKSQSTSSFSPTAKSPKDTGTPPRLVSSSTMSSQNVQVSALISSLKSTTTASEFQDATNSMNVIFSNILMNPLDDAKRTLKMSNQRFFNTVGRHPLCMQLLSLAGFVRDSEKGEVFLPPSAILQRMREVHACLPSST